MSISHPDAEVQSIICMLEQQRDAACVASAQSDKRAQEATAALAKANEELGRLSAALEAAAKFQGGNVIDMKAERVVDLVDGGAAA